MPIGLISRELATRLGSALMKIITLIMRSPLATVLPEFMQCRVPLELSAISNRSAQVTKAAEVRMEAQRAKSSFNWSWFATTVPEETPKSAVQLTEPPYQQGECNRLPRIKNRCFMGQIDSATTNNVPRHPLKELAPKTMAIQLITNATAAQIAAIIMK